MNFDQGNFTNNNQPKINYKILHHFAHKLSCEVKNGLNTFIDNKGKQAKTGVKVDINVMKMSPGAENKNVYEVKIILNVSSNTEDTTLYETNCIYSVLTEIIVDLNDEQQKRVVMVDIPYKMFPVVSVMVSNMIRDAGFGAIMIDSIDFADLYNKKNNNDNGGNTEATESANSNETNNETNN